jgi:type I site-specific restriction endonuclease
MLFLVDEFAASDAVVSMQVLIKCLGREIPDMTGLPEATREATEAPPVAVDVLLGCSGELCAALHGMVEEINGLHIEMSRDWKVLRKKVEDELHAEFNAKLQQMQTRMSRQLQAAGDTTAVTLDRQHSKEKERHHAEMDKEMRDFKLDMAGKKEQMKEQMQQAFDTHVAGLQERVQKTEEENEAMIDALIAETDQLKGEVERKDDYVKEVLSEMESLAEERDRLRQQLEANPRYLSPPGVANSNSSLSLSPNHDMYDGHGIDELERMRLEKRISNLQAAVEQLMESGSSFGSPMPPPPP